jgi:ubiquinone/menaquinone biosynthesis C-methylase UbiE/DNA-binding transcriptional ArsR family regulator
MKVAVSAIPITALLHALGEEIRLRICRILERNELSVGEIAAVVQLPQSTVSRHLKVLASGGLVSRRAVGTATLYRLLRDDLAPPARSLWSTVHDQMGNDPRLAEDLRRLESVLAERKTDSVSYFGQVAGEWDKIRTELFGDGFTAPALLSLLPSDWVVADIGCGTGNAAELLVPAVREVIAIDQSGPMLDAARKRLAGVKSVRFVEGAVTSLPLGSASVDAAVLVLVLHHVADLERAMAELARVVRPGGKALIVDMYEHELTHFRNVMGHAHLGFTAQAMTDLLESAGFAKVRLNALPTTASARGPGLFAAVGDRR